MARKIMVLAGSKRDLPKIREGINLFRKADKQGTAEILGVDVYSAHRNPKEHREKIAEYVAMGADLIVVAAGKLAAIFGNTDAILRNELDCSTTRIIAVPLKGKTMESTLAALYSVLEVPNHKIIFKNEFFENPTAAFQYALTGETEPLILEPQIPGESMSLAEAYEFSRTKLPGVADYTAFIKEMEEGGLFHEYTGKVRETFSYDAHPSLLYFFQTDRISIFDIVLNALIKDKGAVLTAMTVNYLTGILSEIPNHLVAFGSGIDEYLPEALRGNTYLQKHMMVVKKTKVLKVEAIVRGHLTGSGLKDYRKNNGFVCGIQLPEGLIDGSELPGVIFTPSTKAELGDHDENISFEEAVKIIGRENAEKVREYAIKAFLLGRDFMAKRGVIIADTKFEFGITEDGELILIDETLTPDSSRYWPEEGRLAAMALGKTPPSRDKQPIRDEGEANGVKENPDWIPSDLTLNQGSGNYREIACISFDGKTLEEFQADNMHIAQAA